MLRLPAPVQIVVLAALLGAAYFGVCRQFALEAPLSESNLQANLSRIGHFFYDPPGGSSVVLAGSSISGRLLPAHFAAAGLPLQNMGLDGSRPTFVFELIPQRPRPPSILLVEASRLFDPPAWTQANDALLRERVRSPGFALARLMPLLRAQYRPSGILYSRLKARRDEHAAGVALSSDTRVPTAAFPQEYAHVFNQLAAFQKQGVQVAIVEVPWQAGWGVPSHDAATQLAQELDVPYLQPGVALARKQMPIEFSDGQHLNARSARLVAAEIAKEVRASEELWRFSLP